MRQADFPDQTCSIARALEIVGERWTLLVVREAFFGARRFGDFEEGLGIAKNVLSDRLAKLLAAGVLERTSVVGRGNPGDYRLTEKGRDLFPIIIALMQWGDKWTYDGRRAPVRVVDRIDREDILPLRVSARSGRPLGLKDVAVEPGPGADEAIRRRFGA